MTRTHRLLVATLGTAVSASAVWGFGTAASLAWHWHTASAGTGGPVWPVTACAAAGGCLLAARLTVCGLWAVVALLADRRQPAGALAVRAAIATSPRALRPALAALLAGGVALGVASPARATPATDATCATRAPTAAPRSPTSTVVAPASAPAPALAVEPTPRATPAAPAPVPDLRALPSPGWRPPPRAPASRPDSSAVARLVNGGGRPEPQQEVVVRRGDTLWHLAARTLGPGASAAEIAAEWPRWWQANSSVIGADPDLLVPGMRLRAPSTDATPTVRQPDGAHERTP